METIKAIIIAQMLIDNGWEFIHNSHNEIEKVRMDFLDEEISFTNQQEFIDWLFAQENKYVD